MDMNLPTWIFLWLIHNVQSQYIVVSSSSTGWFLAVNECQTNYNGRLANLEEMGPGASIDKCMDGNRMWLGYYSYTTDHLSYKGCYQTPSTFEDGSINLIERSIVECQLNCPWTRGFAIKGNLCKCVLQGSVKDFNMETDYMACQFSCSQTYCGYYGGDSVVSLYLKDSTNRLVTTTNEYCNILVCNQRDNQQFQVQIQEGPCTGMSGVSAYCQNEVKFMNVSTWKEAVEKCYSKGSVLITKFTRSECTRGLQIWSGVRKYNDIFKIEDETPPEGEYIRCGYVESNGRNISFSNCYEWKQFVCITDERDKISNAECSVDLTRNGTTYTYGTEQTKTTHEKLFYQSEVAPANRTGQNIGIIVGAILGVAVVITIPLIVILKWRGFNPRKYIGSKLSNKASLNSRLKHESPKSSHVNSPYEVQLEMNKPDIKMSFCSDDGVQTTSRSAKIDSNNAGGGIPRSVESFGYDLVRPISNAYDIIGEVDTETKDDNSLYHVLEKTQNNKCENIETQEENATNNYDVNKSDNDYDHLRHNHERVSNPGGDYDYSHFAEDNDYGYSVCRNKTADEMMEGDYSHISTDICLSE